MSTIALSAAQRAAIAACAATLRSVADRDRFALDVAAVLARLGHAPSDDDVTNAIALTLGIVPIAELPM